MANPTTGDHTLLYPNSGANDWYATWVGLAQSISDYLDNLEDTQISTIEDGSDNELVKFTSVASAVNFVQITNAATSGDVLIDAAGDDTNIDLNLTPKAAGQLVLDGLNWPTADGSNTQVIQTDGAGQLSFVAQPTGETNTASNVGVGGTAVFKQKTGVDFEFRSINAASSKLSVSADAGNNEVDIDVNVLNTGDLSDVTITGAAKGDLLVYNGSAWVDLTVGSNDDRLTADSAEATGIKWATPSGGGSIVYIETVTGTSVTSLESVGWDTATYDSF